MGLVMAVEADKIPTFRQELVSLINETFKSKENYEDLKFEDCGVSEEEREVVSVVTSWMLPTLQ